MHDDGQHHPQIEEDAVAEEDLAHVGDILHGLREGGADEYGLQVIAHGHETALTDPHDLANILAHAGAEDGQRRPVTFWLARRVMVRKLKIREAMPPAMKAHSRPMSTARKALGDSTAFS